MRPWRTFSRLTSPRVLLTKIASPTDLHAPVDTTGRITDVAFGDVSGWPCCVRWIDGSYSWIAADDDGMSVESDR